MQRFRGFIASCAALSLLASPAFANEQNPPAAASSTQSTSSAPPPDFMLGRPRASVGIRGSRFLASAKSDIYDFITDQLLLTKSDFNTGSFGAEMSFSLTPRLDIAAGLDLNKINRPTEDRNQNELLSDGTRVPIQSVTQLGQTNVFASLKFSLIPRGRSVSRLAWIPATFVPYIGGGGGYGKYLLLQNGDFADFVDNRIFTDTFRSQGWAPTLHVLGGTDIRVARHLLLSFEGKYSWSKANLSKDFVDFAPIDLGGLRFGAGILFAF